MILRFDSLPELQADKMHWRTRAKYRKAWHSAVHWELRNNGWTGNILPPPPFEKAKLVCTRHSAGKAPDADNLAYSFKVILDGLVRSGVLVDDSPEHVVVEYHHKKAPRNRGYVSIEVTNTDVR